MIQIDTLITTKNAGVAFSPLTALLAWEYAAFKYEKKKEQKMEKDIALYGTNTISGENAFRKYKIIEKDNDDNDNGSIKKIVIYETKIKPSYMLNWIYERLKYCFTKLGYYSATIYDMSIDMLKNFWKYIYNFCDDLGTVFCNLVKPLFKIVITPSYYVQGYFTKLNEVAPKYINKNIFYYLRYLMLIGIPFSLAVYICSTQFMHVCCPLRHYMSQFINNDKYRVNFENTQNEVRV